jgi:hypothetical protein
VIEGVVLVVLLWLLHSGTQQLQAQHAVERLAEPIPAFCTVHQLRHRLVQLLTCRRIDAFELRQEIAIEGLEYQLTVLGLQEGDPLAKVLGLDLSRNSVFAGVVNAKGALPEG